MTSAIVCERGRGKGWKEGKEGGREGGRDGEGGNDGRKGKGISSLYMYMMMPCMNECNVCNKWLYLS